MRAVQIVNLDGPDQALEVADLPDPPCFLTSRIHRASTVCWSPAGSRGSSSACCSSAGIGDIALRDFGPLMGALTLSRLASAFPARQPAHTPLR